MHTAWQLLYGNNTPDKTLMVSISQTQDPHRFLKVSYLTMYLHGLYINIKQYASARMAVGIKITLLLMAVFIRVNGIFG